MSELQPDLLHYRKALHLLRHTKERYGEAHVWNSLGQTHERHGDHARASACYQRSHTLFHRFGDRYFEAVVLTRSGDNYHATGDHENARTDWRQALEILDDLDHAAAGQVRGKLNQLDRPR
jgi:tetratricopeptide (TPR) repeat protein